MTKQQVSAWLLLVATIILEVVATLSMKSALENPAFYLVTIVGYASSFVCLTLVLRLGIPLGIAYGIWAASGVALTAILSNQIFDEPFNFVMVIGLILLVGGVLCIEVGAHEKRNAGQTNAAAS